MLPSKNKFSLKTNKPIILASNSAIRKKILRQSGLKFKTIPSELNEILIKMKLKGKPFSSISKILAQEKALRISKKFNSSFVIGADQICVFGKKKINKPLTKEKAVRQLMMLAGKEHKQITGCSICLNGRIMHTFYKTAVLKMRKLSKRQITDYVNYDMPLYSCGAYKFESRGFLLFSNVLGDQFTIQGLPIFSLFNFLLKKNIISYE